MSDGRHAAMARPSAGDRRGGRRTPARAAGRGCAALRPGRSPAAARAGSPPARAQRPGTSELCDLCGADGRPRTTATCCTSSSAGSSAPARAAGRCAPAMPSTGPTGNRTLWLPDLDLPDELWASFQIPIGLAFFMESSVAGCVVALYPSPGGRDRERAALRVLEPDGRSCNPVLADLEPDIEGLIVNRLSEPPAYVIAPIDRCYALTGTIKANWEGISGGGGVERGGRGVLRRAARAGAARHERRSPTGSRERARATPSTAPPAPGAGVRGPGRPPAAPRGGADADARPPGLRAERAAGLHDRADDPGDDRARPAPLRRADA